MVALMSIHNKRPKIIARKTRAKQRRKHEKICCDHVNKCFKSSQINLKKVENKFQIYKKIVNDSWRNLKCFIISND